MKYYASLKYHTEYKIKAMLKILVPVDFSSASDWGFYYAFEFAKKVHSEIIAVHLFEAQHIDYTIPGYKKQEVIEHQKHMLEAALLSSTRPPLSEQGTNEIKISGMVEQEGHRSIGEIARELDVDLIIMGTHGANGAWEKLWGTYTTQVIREAPCPVLAIPAGVSFRSIGTVAYATDFDQNDLHILKEMVVFAQIFNSKVFCLHVDVLSEPSDDALEKEFLTAFYELFPNKEVQYVSRASQSIEEALETFIRINHIAVLGMLTHKKRSWERLFGISQTRSVAMETKVPLLAFQMNRFN